MYCAGNSNIIQLWTCGHVLSIFRVLCISTVSVKRECIGEGNTGHKQWIALFIYFKNLKEIKCDISAFYLKRISDTLKSL